MTTLDTTPAEGRRAALVPGTRAFIAVLAIVGISSLTLLWAVATVRPAGPAWARAAAVVGALAFSVQTALLDALVWPYYFPLPS